MYLYYEHHKNAEGRILLTEMRLSSYGNGKLAIMPKNDLEQMLKQLCLVSLKWPLSTNAPMTRKPTYGATLMLGACR